MNPRMDSVVSYFFKRLVRKQRHIRLLIAEYASRSSELKPEMFRGKRVALIGPADTVKHEVTAQELNEYDVVVRMNKAIDVPLNLPDGKVCRCDILFHSLNETGSRSAGTLTNEKLERCGVKTIVLRLTNLNSMRGFHKKVDALRDREIAANVTFLRPTFLHKLGAELCGFVPTTGFACWRFFLEAECIELFIAGFSFFQTPYLPGYNDKISSDVEAQLWATKDEHHSPELEKRILKHMHSVALKRGKNIRLGSETRKFLLASE